MLDNIKPIKIFNFILFKTFLSFLFLVYEEYIGIDYRLRSGKYSLRVVGIKYSPQKKTIKEFVMLYNYYKYKPLKYLHYNHLKYLNKILTDYITRLIQIARY